MNVTMNLDELVVGSPEWETEVERLQILDDEQQSAAAAETATAQADKKAADEAAAAQAEKAAKANDPEGAASAKADDLGKPSAPGGVLGKDGKTVLPYAALKGAREEARAARQEAAAARERAEALAKELEDLKSGKTASIAAESLTEEELAELTEYAPKAAKAIAEAKGQEKRIVELEAQVKASTKPAAAVEPEGDPVQDAIDQVPTLANWQVTDKEKFERAVAIDAVTRDSPKWKGKPLEARFAHVAKLVAEEYDIQIPEDVKPQPTNGPSKADPEKRIAQAARTEPTTLSDFKGGAVDQTEERLDRMTPIQQLARVQDMNPKEFDEYLAKLG